MKKVFYILFFCMSFICAKAQVSPYDSSRVRQNIEAYGYSWKNAEFRGPVILSKGTPVMSFKDSGAIAYKNGNLKIWNGTSWASVSGGGGGTGFDSTTSHGTTLCNWIGGVSTCYDLSNTLALGRYLFLDTTIISGTAHTRLNIDTFGLRGGGGSIGLDDSAYHKLVLNTDSSGLKFYRHNGSYDGFVLDGVLGGGSGGGGGITGLTGDISASGTGSVVAILPTVNSSVGSFTNANVTVNAKGQVTAVSNGSGGSGGGITFPYTAGKYLNAYGNFSFLQDSIRLAISGGAGISYNTATGIISSTVSTPSLDDVTTTGAYTENSFGVSRIDDNTSSPFAIAGLEPVISDGVSTGGLKVNLTGTPNYPTIYGVFGITKIANGSAELLFPTVSGTKYFALSVNGQTADSYGNITISTPIVGQTTLVAGTRDLVITGLTSVSFAQVTLVSTGGTVSTTWQYSALCNTDTLTIKALTNGGTINTSDTSVLNYSITIY